MYNPYILTDTERDTPRGIRVLREIYSPSVQRIAPGYLHLTNNEMDFVTEIPTSERFEDTHRPPPGTGRNTLHAADIFDPSFAPAPIYYQLPLRPKRTYAEEIVHSTMGKGGVMSPYGDQHQRNDSGYESGAYGFVGDDEEYDGIDAWCDAVLSQASLVEPNRQVLRPDAPIFEPGAYSHSVLNNDEIDMTLRGTNQLHGERNGHPTVRLPPSYEADHASFNIEYTEEEGEDAEQCVSGARFAVTEYELKVLDYEGLNSRLGRGVRDTESEGAKSENGRETYDEQFEVGSRARWSY